MHLGMRTNRSIAASAPGPTTSRSRSPSGFLAAPQAPGGRYPFRRLATAPDIRSARPRQPARSSTGSGRRAGDSRAIERSTFSSSFAPMRGNSRSLCPGKTSPIVDGGDCDRSPRECGCSWDPALGSSAAPARSADISPASRRGAQSCPAPRFPGARRRCLCRSPECR